MATDHLDMGSITYRVIHYRIESVRGKPTKCSKCGKSGGSTFGYHWAHTAGDRTDVRNYSRLCVTCHNQLDGKKRTAKEGGMTEDIDKARRLKKLVLDRVDLVKAPANAPSKVHLFKEDSMEKGKLKIVEEGGKFALYSGDEKIGTYGEKSAAEAKMANMQKSATLEDMMSKLDKTKLPEAVRKHLEELETSNPEAATALAETLAAGQAVAEPVAPVAPVEMGDYAKLQKQLEDERAERVKSDERIAKMELDAKRATFVALAKADLEPLGKAEDLADILLAVEGNLPEATYKSLVQVLKGAAAQLATGEMFKQRASVAGEPTDAETKITELAKEAVKAGVAKTLELGKLHVLNTNPELYAAYRASQDEK